MYMMYFYKSFLLILIILNFPLLAMGSSSSTVSYYTETLNMLIKNSTLTVADIKELNNLILYDKSLSDYSKYQDINKILLDKYVDSIEEFQKMLNVSKSDALKTLNAIVARQYSNRNYAFKENLPSKLNLNLSKDEAKKIVEIIIVKMYGKEVLSQRPWKIVESNNTYIIKGHNPLLSNERGGIVTVIINKQNAEILDISHGR